MSAPFVHLHVHSQYSMLDGAIRLPDLIKKAQEYEMEAVAVTDHGAMFGALEFYEKATKAGIKPLIGCEFYITSGELQEKGVQARQRFHQVLLAMNETGYRNLMRLASIAQVRGMYIKPRIDYRVLAEHQEGLLALSACLKGEVPWRIGQGDMDGARARALAMREIFADRYYFEIQENGIPEQTVVNNGLLELSSDLGIKVVATNDCHYLNRDEAHAHEVLLCIQTGKTINDPRHFKFDSDQLYFKSPEEMAAQFAYCPEALSNTVEVAQRCDLQLSFGRHHFPAFPVEKGKDLDTMFDEACRRGLEERFAPMIEDDRLSRELEKQYRARLEHEISVIKKMGFSGYFLIVADFINWAKEQKIPVGPGRGSGAGSLAAYCMKITDIDPIPYGLIFERFLNVERQSMPDFDVDFCKDRRDEVLEYVRQKYGGADHVAQIVAYGSMKARAAIRDVGRALEIPLPVVDRIAKLVPEELKMTIDKALAQEERLRVAMKEDPQIDKLVSIARTLEGLSRHKTIHAAGVVISPTPMVDYLPVCVGPGKEILTQYDMKYTEKTGLIKFDFLGLKTLTVIDRALKHIEVDPGLPLDLSRIPMDDPCTYELLSKGDSLGVFQLESDGMRELLIKMKPELFSDLIALVALYRPGPMESGMINTFVETKHGHRLPEYPLPQIKPVLEETYGVIVYQEQVMQIANILAGYSLGDADNLRRAMGKKIPEVMEQERAKFMAGAMEKKIPEDKAKYIFDLMAKFAGYGFNKSHSAAYALIAYQTAYLKAHYPAQFLAALLSCDMDNTDKVVRYINECKLHDIDVLPPDINESYQDFTVVRDRIRFGLAAVRNVGGAALLSVIEEREKNGPYRSLADFCGRIDSARVNRKVIESLIKAGAFDSISSNRARLFAGIDLAIERARAAQRDRLSGQMSLFAMAAAEKQTIVEEDLPEAEEWPALVKLNYENESIGFFLTGHPLEGVQGELAKITDCSIEALAECRDGQVVRVGGLLRSYKDHKSKKGERMAFIELEDMTASVEVVIFPSTFSTCGELLAGDGPFIVLGKVQQGERGPKLIAGAIDTVSDAFAKYAERAIIRLQADRVRRQHMEQLKELLYQFHGVCPVVLTLHFDGRGEVDVEVLKDLKVRLCSDFFREVEKILGYSSLRIALRQAEIQEMKRNGKFFNSGTDITH